MTELRIRNYPLNKGVVAGGGLCKACKGFVKRIPKNMIDLEDAESVRVHAERIIHRMDAHIERLQSEEVVFPDESFELIWLYDIETEDVLVIARLPTL